MDASDEESLKAARDHFACAGCSQGAIAGWNGIIPDCYDYFASCAFFSGNTGNIKDVADTINNKDKENKYLYCGQGDHDEMILDGMDMTYASLLEATTKVNASNSVNAKVYDTGHFYDSFITQLYNSLPVLF